MFCPFDFVLIFIIYSDVSRVFLDRLKYIMNRDWRRIGKSSKFVPPDALKEHSLALPVPRIPSLDYKTLLFVEDLKKKFIYSY